METHQVVALALAVLLLLMAVPTITTEGLTGTDHSSSQPPALPIDTIDEKMTERQEGGSTTLTVNIVEDPNSP